MREPNLLLANVPGFSSSPYPACTPLLPLSASCLLFLQESWQIPAFSTSSSQLKTSAASPWIFSLSLRGVWCARKHCLWLQILDLYRVREISSFLSQSREGHASQLHMHLPECKPLCVLIGTCFMNFKAHGGQDGSKDLNQGRGVACFPPPTCQSKCSPGQQWFKVIPGWWWIRALHEISTCHEAAPRGQIPRHKEQPGLSFSTERQALSEPGAALPRHPSRWGLPQSSRWWQQSFASGGLTFPRLGSDVLEWLHGQLHWAVMPCLSLLAHTLGEVGFTFSLFFILPILLSPEAARAAVTIS